MEKKKKKKSIINIYNDDDNNTNDMRLFWIQFKSVYQLGERVIFSQNVCCIQVFLFSSVCCSRSLGPGSQLFFGRNWLLLAV